MRHKEAVVYRIVKDKDDSRVAAYIELARFQSFEDAEKYASTLGTGTELYLSWE